MYKIAAITDMLTGCAMAADAHLFHLTPFNYKLLLKYAKPDIVFVESAWQGWQNSWKYKIANYPGYPKRTNQDLIELISYAKSLDIPTIFWNKEDSVHFARFIESARHFDYIYTVDVNVIPKYQQYAPKARLIDALPFPIQSKIHFPYSVKNTISRASFVGSFSTHIHPKRLKKQIMLFEAAQKTGLDIYDRNSDRKNSQYRFPILSDNTKIYKKISPFKTANIYNKYLVNLNINTIEDSHTMFSRRLIEILACEAMAITTTAQSVDHYFANFCYTVTSSQEAQAHIMRICQDGLSQSEKEMLKAGCDYVHKEFSYKKFLAIIMKNIAHRNPKVPFKTKEYIK